MGNICNSRKRMRKYEQHKDLWGSIQEFSFDNKRFKLMCRFQQLYLDNLGREFFPQRMKILISQFKKFLFLVALVYQHNSKGLELIIKSPDKIVPSPLIDRVWKLALTSTETYQKFCQQMFGAAFHHRSSLKRRTLSDYQKTVSLLYDYFGGINHNVWPYYNSSQQLQRGLTGFIWVKIQDLNSIQEETIKLKLDRKTFQRKIEQKYYEMRDKLFYFEEEEQQYSQNNYERPLLPESFISRNGSFGQNGSFLPQLA